MVTDFARVRTGATSSALPPTMVHAVLPPCGLTLTAILLLPRTTPLNDSFCHVQQTLRELVVGEWWATPAPLLYTPCLSRTIYFC